ncbi:MAG: TerB family tellurite resistance protein [Flavobacteriaceae bacterium]
MPILDLYYHSEQKTNLAHFAAIASLAAVDGEVNPREKAVLDRFAHKLGISDEEYKEVMKKSNQYPIEPQNEAEKRLERLYDLFRMIFADHNIDDEEMALLKKYAIGIGFPVGKVDRLIEMSVAIFTGRIAFDDYLLLLVKNNYSKGR